MYGEEGGAWRDREACLTGGALYVHARFLSLTAQLHPNLLDLRFNEHQPWDIWSLAYAKPLWGNATMAGAQLQVLRSCHCETRT